MGRVVRQDISITPGMKAYLFGDSITGQCLGQYTSDDGIAAQTKGTGFHWVQDLLGHPFEHWNIKNYGDTDSITGKQGYNKGDSGDSLDEMLARLNTDILQNNPDIVFFMGGTNSIKGNQSFEEIIGYWNDIVSQILDQGIILVAYTVTPRNSSNNWDSDTERQILFDFNNYIRSRVQSLQATGAKILLVDPWDSTRSILTGNAYDLRTTASTDGLHPDSNGALAIAKATLAVLEQFNLKDLNRHYDATVWNTSTAPFGNTVVNSAFDGTSGSTSGTGATGDVPNNWNLVRQSGSSSGITATATKVTEDGRNAIKIAISSNGTGQNNDRFQFRSDYWDGVDDGIVDGNTYVGQARVKIGNAIGDILRMVSMEVYDQDGGRDVYAGVANTSDNLLPFGDYDRLLRTPLVTYDSLADDVRIEFDIYIDGTVSGSFDLTIWDVDFRAIENPPTLS